MSRIGQSPISLPEGVNVDINGTLIKVSGKKAHWNSMHTKIWKF